MSGLRDHFSARRSAVLAAAFVLAGCAEGQGPRFGELGRSNTTYQEYPNAKPAAGVGALNELAGCEPNDDSCRQEAGKGGAAILGGIAILDYIF